MIDPKTLQEDAETVHEPQDKDKVQSVVELGEEMQSIKDRIDRGKAFLSRLQERYDNLRKEVIPEKMREAGLVSQSGKGRFTLPDGSMVYLQGDLQVHVPKSKREKFYAFLEERGEGDLISRTIPWQTLRAWAREQMRDGKDLPDMVEAHTYLVARVRKS